MKVAKRLSDQRVHDEALAQMDQRGGTWAAYENHDLGSGQVGHLQFIKYGPGCTFATPPEKCPDTSVGFGWRYVFVGVVDLATGTIVEYTPAAPAESSTP